MNNRNEILGRIKGQIKTRYNLPEINLTGIQYPDPIIQFMEVLGTVGGKAMLLNEDNINDVIRLLFPNSVNIASNLTEITIATLNPDTLTSPHELKDVDLAVIEAELGVAENGAVWIPQNVKERALYFIAEYLIVVLDKKKIINNMHEAYSLIHFSEEGFGVFISGPSKTADIEQALVIGAHGAKGLTVIIR